MGAAALDAHLKKKGLLPRTRRQYSSIVRRIGRKDPVKWLEERIGAHTPIGTILPFRAACKHYLMSERGLTDEEASELLPKAKGRPGRLRNSLSPQELSVYVEESDKRSNPVRTILLLLPKTGMRIGEMCNLRTSDLTEMQGVRGFLFRGKRSQQRFVPLQRSAQSLIDSYLDESHDGGEWMFSGYRGLPMRPDSVRKVTRRMAGTCKELEGLSPHLLRHTFATEAIRAGMDLKKLQALLGHASIETTSRYLHPDAQMLFDALAALEEG